MSQRLSGVNVNEIQSNPFQPDVTYRGFTASPLLGTPQGLSVYQDGVRINEPFGDTVNWDLIPTAAISTINLIPGVESAVRPEHARRRAVDPDQERRAVSGDRGAALRRLVRPARARSTAGRRERRAYDYFVSASGFREDGWRVQSPSDVRQFFAKVGLAGRQVGHRLQRHSRASPTSPATGSCPAASYTADPKQAYTLSDNTQNRMTLLSRQRDALADERYCCGRTLRTIATARSRRATATSIEVSDPRNGVTPFEDGDPNASSTNRTSTGPARLRLLDSARADDREDAGRAQPSDRRRRPGTTATAASGRPISCGQLRRRPQPRRRPARRPRS